MMTISLSAYNTLRDRLAELSAERIQADLFARDAEVCLLAQRSGISYALDIIGRPEVGGDDLTRGRVDGLSRMILKSCLDAARRAGPDMVPAGLSPKDASNWNRVQERVFAGILEALDFRQ